jgi:hypothetical protein
VKSHNWVKLTEYNGHLGWNTFYRCTECSACGGPAIGKPWPPFIADGSGAKLSDDCDEAIKQIMNHPGVKK